MELTRNWLPLFFIYSKVRDPEALFKEFLSCYRPIYGTCLFATHLL